MKVDKPEDIVLVYWTHPAGDGVPNSTLYHKDQLNKALTLYRETVKFNNTPAWVYHKGEFIEYHE